jgi:prepilin-type N-terminal cleavage/methylation domain-containing protein
MQKIIPAIKNLHRRCLGVTPRQREQGFTLVEIVIAVIIMGLAYVVILQSFSLSTRNIAKVEAIRNSLLEYALEFEQQSFAQRLGDEDAVEMNESVSWKEASINSFWFQMKVKIL